MSRHIAPLSFAAIVSCGGGGSALNQTTVTCPAGRTLLDGVCVSNTVADYVACVRAQGAQLGGSKSQQLSADVGYLGARASGASELSETLERRYQVSDAATLAVIEGCKARTTVDETSSRPSSAATTRTESGCSDGQREGFVDVAREPRIAGCGGAFSVPGVISPRPTCARKAGDDSENASGVGCSVADLCAEGWHVCRDFTDVALHASSQSCDGAVGPGDKAFFVTQQSGPGACRCGEGTNDLFGCGNLAVEPKAFCGAGRGIASAGDGCGALTFSGDLCFALGASWRCGSDGNAEATNVVKPAVTGGGALCCKN